VAKWSEREGDTSRSGVRALEGAKPGTKAWNQHETPGIRGDRDGRLSRSATTEAQRQQAKTLAIIHGTVVDVETGALLKDAASAGSRVNTS